MVGHTFYIRSCSPKYLRKQWRSFNQSWICFLIYDLLPDSLNLKDKQELINSENYIFFVCLKTHVVFMGTSLILLQFCNAALHQNFLRSLNPSLEKTSWLVNDNSVFGLKCKFPFISDTSYICFYATVC